MANTIKNRSPSDRSPSKGRKVSTSIVTPPKKVKKGESKIAAKKQSGEKASSLSKRQLSSSLLSFSVAGLVVAAVVVFAFRYNGTIVYKPNHTNEEEEERH
jgi:hypothetical protein